jgi:hypothetical protein
MENRGAALNHPKQDKQRYSHAHYVERNRTQRSHPTEKHHHQGSKFGFGLDYLSKLVNRPWWPSRKGLIDLTIAIVVSLVAIKILPPLLFFPAKVNSARNLENSLQRRAVVPQKVPFSTVKAVVAIRLAILGQESNGDSQAINPHSGALGLAQVMSANLEDWSQDALGYTVAPDEFLESPELQVKVIDYRLSEYWREAWAESKGHEAVAVQRVAAYWYSGNPDLYTSTKPQWYQGVDGQWHRYPSVSEYSQMIWRRYQKARNANRQ